MGDTAISPDKGTVQLGFVGDLLLGRKVRRKIIEGQPPDFMWGDLRPRQLATDAMIGNLECPITTHATKWNKLKTFYFRTDPKAIDHLHAGNFRCVALANNHLVDYGNQGLIDTRNYLESAGIAFAGAGIDGDQALEPTVFSAGQMKIGFMSITNTVPAFAAKPGRPGTNYWKIRPDAPTLDRLGGMIGTLKSAGAELIILSIHWGPNYRWWPPKHYRAFAHRAIDLGVDVVHGHSAHVLQAVEFHGRGIILFDTGDYVDDFIVVPPARSDYSFLFLVEAGPGRMPKLTMVPARLTLARVDTARGREADVIRRAMIRRCADFAVDIREEDGDLVATAPNVAQARQSVPPTPIASASKTANRTNRYRME
ncbi:MAG: CapA family protein [Hyphomicrobiales bacterium]|nr:CapA family protein [Hyphomicrobiales bacterium]